MLGENWDHMTIKYVHEDEQSKLTLVLLDSSFHVQLCFLIALVKSGCFSTNM